jgi:Zn-dependent peptidase ImmA (M78 family)
LYKCAHCGKQFLGGQRINNEQIWEEYKSGKQTYLQLAHKYNCSVKTIQRRLDKIKIVATKKTGRVVVVLMDTTYWGRGFGVMLFKDAYTKENLLKYYVKRLNGQK